ncbi:hypothetical protein JZ751_014665, partial [Albula glossodonta]
HFQGKLASEQHIRELCGGMIDDQIAQLAANLRRPLAPGMGYLVPLDQWDILAPVGRQVTEGFQVTWVTLVPEVMLVNKETRDLLARQLKVLQETKAIKVSPVFLESSNMAVMVPLETPVSQVKQAGQAALGTRDLQESVTRQLAREHQLLGNPPIPRTIKTLCPSSPPHPQFPSKRRGRSHRVFF